MPELPKLPPIRTAPLSLVLLARNAGTHVAAVVVGWREVLLARQTPFEIVVIDDGSDDDSPARLEELLVSVPELKVRRLDRPTGDGAALRTGLAEVIHPLVACAPCDPAHRPQDLALLLAEIDRVHFLTGYRAGRPVPWACRAVGLLWRLLTRVLFNHTPERLPGWLGWRRHVGALLARVFFGVRLRDVTCPYRLFRREILARTPLQARGGFAWVEQLAKVNFTSDAEGGPRILQEVALPIVPPPARPLDRALLREAARVFSHPSFGPVVIPPPAG